MLKKFRAKHPKLPKPVPPPKPPRPSISKLRNIYRDLISSDVDQRVETLKKVVHWYEGALAYVVYFKAISFTQKKALAAAQGFRIVALTTNKDETKEKNLIAAIHEYEKIVRKLKPPKVNTFYSKFSSVRSTLEKRKRRFNRKFHDFLEVIDKALKPVNYEGRRISMRVDKLSHERRINSVGDVTFDRKYIDMARKSARKYGLLSGVLIVIPILAEAAATKPERDHEGHRTGRYVVSGTAKSRAWEEMMNNLFNYCLTSKTHVRLVRRQKDAPSVHKTAA